MWGALASGEGVENALRACRKARPDFFAPVAPLRNRHHGKSGASFAPYPSGGRNHLAATEGTSMMLRNFALIYGIAFLLVGVLGFVPGVNQAHVDHTGLVVTGPGHGMLLGLFHVNLLHNLVHVVFGGWGLVASRSFSAARLYARGVAVIYALLAVCGLIPGLNTMFGLVPIEGNDVWLHLLLAAVAAYFGFVAPAVNENAMMTDTTNSAGTPRTS
jgi:hypothetical protein